jgi:UPF0755 protein
MSKSKPHFLLRRPLLATYFIIIVTLILGGWFWLNAQLSPVNGTPQTKIFVINKGQGINSIGAGLKSAGLIHSPLAFKFIVTQKNLAKKIQAGTFRLSPSMSALEIAQNLTHGTLDVWVTIIEGWRREEIAAAVKKAFDAAGANFNEEQFLKVTKDQEGYLYPDTYLFPITANETAIASLLKNTFDKKVTQDLETDIAASGKSLNDIVTMASLVEREARSETARKMVAGILWKRLEAGWPLQVDATLQYAKGYDKKDQTWWTPPTALDKKVNSPFNTYTNSGLPPGPIASPSLSAIEASLNPTPSAYWFYLTGTDNQMHYAKTVEEHNQNIQRYL